MQTASFSLNTITEPLLLQNQMGFTKGKSCIDNIFSINQIIQKRRVYNIKTYLAFVDLEKAVYNVSRTRLWKVLDKKGIQNT